MTVAELIEQLKQHPPGKPVKVCPRRSMLDYDGGDFVENLMEDDADEADEVRNEGGFVLIWGGKP